MGEGLKIQRQLPIFDTNTYLYKEGDEYNDLTGGWIAGLSGGSGSQSKNTDHLYASVTPSSVDLATRTYVTNSPIDVTNFTVLKVRCELSKIPHQSKNGRGVVVGLISTKMNRTDTTAVALSRKSTQGESTLELDISLVSGSYYVAVQTFDGATTTSISSKTYEIWLK